MFLINYILAEINMENKDLKLRNERKFVIHKLDLKEIEHVIKLNSGLFKEIYSPRQVNNIYLDSFNMDNYHDNISGNSSRLKIRIRWYGNMFGLIKNGILEFKIKEGELGKKLKFELNEFSVKRNFSEEHIKNVIIESNISDYIKEIIMLTKISLINSYKRRYYISTDNKFRITLDNELKFFETRERNNLFIKPIEDKETFILEIKYNFEHGDIADKIMQEFPFRLIKSSKYISGINLTHNF